MKPKKPLISIVVPVYNIEKYIHKCIHSILTQSYTNLEVILVDDGSPDNCPQICDEYAAKDCRIKVIHQKNLGVSGARNSGLKNATGEYVGFVDSDDWIHPKMYEEMLDVLIKENLDVVECQIQRSNKPIEIEKPFSYTYSVENQIEAFLRVIENQDFSVWRRLYKKVVIKNLNFRLGKIYEDVYFTTDLLLKVKKLAFIHYPLYFYFTGNKSITRETHSLKTLDSIEAAVYLQQQIYDSSLKSVLFSTTQKFIQQILLYNYKLLQLNPKLDQETFYRNKVRSLIKLNYTINSKLQVQAARFIPIRLYNFLLLFIRRVKNIKKNNE